MIPLLVGDTFCFTLWSVTVGLGENTPHDNDALHSKLKSQLGSCNLNWDLLWYRWLSTLGIGNFVEARIDAVHCIALTFGAGSNDAYFCNLSIGCALTTQFDELEGENPT